jgi:hypothetical protein
MAVWRVTLKVVETHAGGGTRTRTELSLQRILSSIESCPPASKPKQIAGSAVHRSALHPPLSKPVAVILAVKIFPSNDSSRLRGLGVASSNPFCSTIQFSRFSDISENRSKSARVRAIRDRVRTRRTPSAARIPRIEQNLSGHDLPRSTDHRL